MAGEDLNGLTAAAVSFTARHDYGDIPEAARKLLKRCVLDGLAVALAGSEQEIMRIAERHVLGLGGDGQARLIGHAGCRVSAAQAAFCNGIAGHAMDWDDTQLAEGPGRPYGLLTHPTIPPLMAALAVADLQGGASGEAFMTAFSAGFEVECKIAEAISPDHYNLGFHTSGTIGTFGAAAAAGKLLGLDEARLAAAIGLAASMAAGIRANFGTMGKPMHVGRAAENGVTAALLAAAGFTGSSDALDGRWGYLAVAGRGGEPARVRNRFGAPLSILAPGVSIKPYPCGVLTHPSMDAMAALMRENGLETGDIERATLHAGTNILNPIRFAVATTDLEGKFCMAFLLAAIAIAGKAGKAEFSDEFVARDDVQALQRRITTAFDPAIEAMGFECIRSRLDVVTRDGRRFEKWADENYRGGPHNPLSDVELEGKFADCAAGLMEGKQAGRVFDFVWALERQDDVTAVLDLLDWQGAAA
jgi:2-methylcitrate dehydratase PrpD